MKVAIITITELDNFGNRLQNYALQETLKKMGADVETIPNLIVYGDRRKFSWKLKMLKKGIKENNKKYLAELCKQYRFSRFDNKYFDFSEEYSTVEYIPKSLNEKYDFFIAGSDQIWNPHFTFNFDFNFLAFAEYEKCISYAASFGVQDIPNEKKDDFANYLNGIRKLSVREFAGGKIVRELTAREAEVLIDPTLLLSKEDWLRMAKKPFWNQNKRYIITYFLGDISEREEVFEKISSEMPNFSDLKIIDINEINNLSYFSIRPDEFVWLISNAELVVTDSFHGTVFSVLMEVPFVSIERKGSRISMNSRIETLYGKLGLKDDSLIKWPDSYRDVVKEKLYLERKKSESFLKESMRIG